MKIENLSPDNRLKIVCNNEPVAFVIDPKGSLELPDGCVIIDVEQEIPPGKRG